MTPFSRRSLALLALLTGLAGTAHAQRPGGQYSIAPLLRSSTTGAGIAYLTNLQRSTINQAPEVIGNHPVTGASIRSNDTLIPLGNDRFQLELRLLCADDLAPLGSPVGGTPSDECGIVIGEILNGGAPLEFQNGRAAFLSAATFSVFRLDGSRMIPPVNAMNTFRGLNDPDFGGGWNGSVAMLLPQNRLTGPVGGYEVVLEYRLGIASDYRQIWNSGCDPLGQVSPSLEPVTATVLGLPMTFEVSSITTPNVFAVSLLLDVSANGNGPNLAIFGAPQCNLIVDNPFFAAPMIVGSGDARVTLQTPSDLSLAGAELFVQALGFASDGARPITGLFVSNVGRVTIGG